MLRLLSAKWVSQMSLDWGTRIMNVGFSGKLLLAIGGAEAVEANPGRGPSILSPSILSLSYDSTLYQMSTAFIFSAII